MSDNVDAFCEKAESLLKDDNDLYDMINEYEDKLYTMLSWNDPMKYIFDTNGFDIVINVGDIVHSYEKETSNVADQIKRHIDNLKPNETKKIAVVLDGGNHCVGMVIGKTNEGKSYIFLDRENEKGRYLGSEEGVFLKKIEDAVDRIILIPQLQSDHQSCFIYSYILCKACERDERAKELIEKAFAGKDKIYKHEDKKFPGALADELPLLLQLIYQRDFGKLKKNIKINDKIINTMKAITDKDHEGDYFYQYNDPDERMNNVLGFLTKVAASDPEDFLQIIDSMIYERGVNDNKTRIHDSFFKRILQCYGIIPMFGEKQTFHSYRLGEAKQTINPYTKQYQIFENNNFGINLELTSRADEVKNDINVIYNSYLTGKINNIRAINEISKLKQRHKDFFR